MFVCVFITLLCIHLLRLFVLSGLEHITVGPSQSPQKLPAVSILQTQDRKNQCQCFGSFITQVFVTPISTHFRCMGGKVMLTLDKS